MLTGGCTREELLEAGADVVLTDLTEFPAWLDEHLLRPALAALEETCAARGRCWSRSAAAPTRVPAGGRGPRARRRTGGGGDGVLRLAARGRARPGRGVRGSPGRQVLTPATARDGAGGLPRQRRRPLLLLQGRAARRTRPAGRRARLRARRDRHQRRRRRGRLPARASRAAAERGARHPAARRRPHQGAGPGGLPALGAADLGQARRRLPVARGSPTASRSRRPGWPGSSAPRPALRARARPPTVRRSATCGSATSASRPGSRSTRDAGRAAGASDRGARRRRVEAGFDDGRGGPARVPVGVDERAAAGSRSVPLNSVGVRCRTRRRTAVRSCVRSVAIRTQRRGQRWCPPARSSGTTPRRASASCPARTGTTSTCAPTSLPEGVTTLKAGTRVEFGILSRAARVTRRSRCTVLDAPPSVSPDQSQRAAQEARGHGRHRRGPDEAARRRRAGLPRAAGTPTRRRPSRPPSCCAPWPTSSSSSSAR